MKILIVDDDKVCQKIMDVTLRQYGECSIANDGIQAIKAVEQSYTQSSPFDIICLDVMMPGMDGHQVLSKIRDIEEQHGILLGHGSKIIMATALSGKDSIMESFRSSCDGYIVKPVNDHA